MEDQGIVNTNAADALATQGAKVSAVMALTCFSRNISVSAPEGLPQVHLVWEKYKLYRKVSNIKRTKSQNLNDSRLVLQLSLPNRLKPGVKSRMKM